MRINLTLAIIAANVLLYLVELSMPEWMIVNFALWPLNSGGQSPGSFQLWQLVSYSFLHDWNSWTHLLLNMWGLFMFGQSVEEVLGMKRYAGLYISSVLAAAFTQLAFYYIGGMPPGPTVGASGAVFGVMLAYAYFFPERKLLLIFLPIPLPARVFVVLYAALELFLGVTGTQEGVAHFAHLGGLLGALAFLRRPAARR